MASDFPFSVTSKFIDTSGAEHLVTIRAATVDDFAKRLADAATLFPYAGFTRPQGQTEADPTPIVRGDIVAATIQTPETERELTQRANQRAAVRRVERKNGDGPPSESPLLCPVHGRQMYPSRWGGWYCPVKDEEDQYCKEKVAA